MTTENLNSWRRELAELEQPSPCALESAAEQLGRVARKWCDESDDVGDHDEAEQLANVADWLTARARMGMLLAGTEELLGAARGALSGDAKKDVDDIIGTLSLAELELIALSIKARVAGVAAELDLEATCQ